MSLFTVSINDQGLDKKSAEVAFAVVDPYQGQGIGAALLRHLVTIARAASLRELIAEVLPDNMPMLKVFEKSGIHVASKREAGLPAPGMWSKREKSWPERSSPWAGGWRPRSRPIERAPNSPSWSRKR